MAQAVAPGPRPSREKEDAASDRDGESEPPLPRRLFAEALGAGFLTFVAAGAEIDAVLSHGKVDLVAKAVAPGFVVMAMIYAMGDVSGAHFNPAVTTAFALRRVFSWRQVPAYWAAQFGGAIAAAALLRSLFGTTARVGSSQLHTTTGRGFVLEIVLSWLLITIILNTATRNRVVGPEAAIAVGATIALCGLFAEPLSGASMNPVRSLGPAFVSGTLTHQWIYVVAPLTGAVLATATSRVLHPHREPEEVKVANGDGETA
jgi:aquaporin Z